MEHAVYNIYLAFSHGWPFVWENTPTSNTEINRLPTVLEHILFQVIAHLVCTIVMTIRSNDTNKPR